KLEVLLRAMSLGFPDRKGALVNSVLGDCRDRPLAGRFVISASLRGMGAWFHQGCSAALQMVHEVLCEIRFRVSDLLQCIMEGPSGRDVLLPNTKEDVH